MSRAIDLTPALRRSLWADAAVTLPVGLLQVGATAALAAFTQLPAALLVASGLFMLAYAALLGVLARGERIATGWLRVIVFGNLGWAAACVLIWAAGWVAPNGWGLAYLLMQADVVLVLALWQGWAWRSAARGAAHTAGPLAAGSMTLRTPA